MFALLKGGVLFVSTARIEVAIAAEMVVMDLTVTSGMVMAHANIWGGWWDACVQVLTEGGKMQNSRS